MVLTAAACSGGEISSDSQITESPSATAYPSTSVTESTVPLVSTILPATSLSSTTVPSSTTTEPRADADGFQLLPGDSVPWDVVSDEWLLVLLEGEGRDVLAVTSPEAASYELMSWPSDWLLDRTIVGWQPEREEALLLLPGHEPTAAKELWLVDLKSGDQTMVESVSWSYDTELWGGFTRPTGANLLVMVHDQTGVRLERRSRAGELLATFSSQPSGRVSWLYGAGGEMVVVADTSGISLLSNRGEFIRTLKEPFSEPTVPLEDSRIGGCEVVGWWTEHTAIATCWVRAANPGSPVWGELWQIPIDGSQPVLIRTNPLSYCEDGPPGMPVSMWLTDTGSLIEVLCPLGVGEDGPHHLGVFDLSMGSTDAIEVVGAWPENRVVDVAGDEVVLVSVSNSGGATALVSVTVDSNATALTMRRLLVPNVRQVATRDRVVSVLRYQSFGPLPTIRNIIEPIEQRLAESFEGEKDLPDWMLGPMYLRCEDEDRSVGRGDVFACLGSAQTVADPRYALDPLSVVFLVLDDTGEVAIMSGTDGPYSSSELIDWHQRSGNGLSCSGPLSYFDLMLKWFVDGMPESMDIDGDGVPCEGEYPFEEVAWVLSGGEDW
jgi:hypothetical protein